MTASWSADLISIVLFLRNMAPPLRLNAEHGHDASADLVDRACLQRAGDVRVVYLAGDAATIAERLASRQHKYMPPTLLPSQFAALEEPSDAIRVDIRQPVDAQVRCIRDAFALSAAARP